MAFVVQRLFYLLLPARGVQLAQAGVFLERGPQVADNILINLILAHRSREAMKKSSRTVVSMLVQSIETSKWSFR